MYSTYLMAKDCIDRGVPGDFVECGVFAGAQAAAMAYAVMQSGDRRKVHLFDSFQGIPQAGANDLEFLAAGHQPGLSMCSLAEVKGHMAEWGIDPALLVYHAGWFKDTLQSAGIERIALLRLDGDLYESSKVVMEQMYPLLSCGGWCIVDDFGLTGCRKAVVEYMDGQIPPVYWQAV